MKKILSIALIAMLVLTAAFADVTFEGSAEIDFSYDLDKTAYGFANGTGTSLEWMLESGKGGSEGEKDLKAVIAGEWKVKNAEISSSSIKKAEISYKDVTVGILNSGSANYASSYYKNPDTGKPVVDKIKTESTHKTGEKTAPTASYDYNADTDTWGWVVTPGKDITAPVAGFTVSYKGYKLGFGTEGDVKAKENTTWVLAETASIAVVEGASVQAAGAALIEDGKATIFGNAKAAFKNDTVNASVAADVKYASEKIAVEASAKVAVAPVTVDAFCQYAADKFVLDAKVSADWKIEEVSGNVYVDLRDVTKTSKIDATVGGEAVFAPCTVAAAVRLVYADEVTTIAPTAKVSSDALIDNCTVVLAWTGADFKADAMGAITAAAKIKF